MGEISCASSSGIGVWIWRIDSVGTSTECGVLLVPIHALSFAQCRQSAQSNPSKA